MKRTKLLALLCAAMLTVSSTACAAGAETKPNPDVAEVPAETTETPSGEEVSATEEPSAGEERSIPDEQVDPAFLTSLDKFSSNAASAVFTATGTDKNLCFSPISLAYALGMLSAGAQGSTFNSLSSTLTLSNNDPSTVLHQFSLLIPTHMGESESAVIETANSIWMQKDFPFLDSYTQSITDAFQAESFLVDFEDAATADQMAQWVTDQTHGTIQSKFVPDPMQVLSLINTIYLKAAWMDPFQPENTTTGEFHTADGSSINASFMEQLLMNHKYTDVNNCRVVEMPLGSGLSMSLILPNIGIDAGSLATDPATLDALLNPPEANSKMADITIQLPRFSYDTTLNLKNTLQSLGLGELFEDPDLSAMTTEDVAVSSCIQQTHIAVDEEGCEAAAMTAIGIAAMSAPITAPEQITFRLDRPFLFAIQDYNDLPLFIGLVNQPDAQ